MVVWTKGSLAVARRCQQNKIEWVKMSSDVSRQLIVDDSYKPTMYKKQNIVAEGPMQLSGLSEQMMNMVMNHSTCTSNKQKVLEDLSPWLSSYSLMYWEHKILDGRQKKKFKVAIEKFDLLSMSLYKHIFSFLDDQKNLQAVPLGWNPDKEEIWCVFNFLMIKKSISPQSMMLTVVHLGCLIKASMSSN